MSRRLVLLTGGNGYVGYAVLTGLLNAGYHVRASVRRQDAIYTISQGPTAKTYIDSGALTFVIVPDFGQPHALTEAAKDCAVIVHTASPLPTARGDLTAQALAGTKAVLQAAEETPTVRRVVFTSSVSALVEPDKHSQPASSEAQQSNGKESDGAKVLTGDATVPTLPPLPDNAPGAVRYSYSKIHSHNYVKEYIASKAGSTPFNVVNIMPGYVIGPTEAARNKREGLTGSNVMLAWLFVDLGAHLKPLVGLRPDEEMNLGAQVVSLEDTVDAHVNAARLEADFGTIENFLLCSDGPEGPTYADAMDIVKADLKAEVECGIISFAGRPPGEFSHRLRLLETVSIDYAKVRYMISSMPALPSPDCLVTHTNRMQR